jgi:type IV secretion system protein VirB4
LDGQRVSLYFDEGWQILDNEYWKHQLKQDLPTLRKLNAHIVLATQSPESVVNSALSAQFLDNCATHIFFCNGSANYEKHYRHFNLTLSEFEFLKNTPKERRLFLYKQAEDSAIAKLNLSGMEDELAVYSGNKSTVALLDKIRGEVGDDPQKWLPIFHERRVVEGRS